MDELDLIKAYQDMKALSIICEENKINYSNLINGKTTKDNEKKIANAVKMEILKIYALLKIKMEEN